MRRRAIWSCSLLGHRYGEGKILLQACCPPADAVTPTLCWTSHRPTIIRAIAGEPGCHLSGRVLRRCVQCLHLDVRELPVAMPHAGRAAGALESDLDALGEQLRHVAKGVTP